MRLGKHHTKQEQAELQEQMPEGVYLFYSLARGNYEIRAPLNTSNAPAYKVLRSIPRREMMKWDNPTSTINYVARRAMWDNKLPVAMKMKNTN